MSSGIFRGFALSSVVALVAYAGTAGAQSLTVSASHTDVSCKGGGNGTATAFNIQNGTPPYFYSWAPSGGTNATATVLQQGTYTVTVTDSNALQGTASTTVGEPAAALSGTQSHVNPVGSNANGSATVVAAGGTPGYTYSWSPSGGTAATATGLVAGNYSVWITDANGCAKQVSVTLTAQSPSVQSVSVPANGTYSFGQPLVFTVAYNAPINVAGSTPFIPLTVGSTSRQAAYFSGSGSSTLTFRYVVQAGDLDADGISVGSLIDLNGSTMTSGTADAELNLASVGTTTGVLVDGMQAQTITFANPGAQNFGTTPTLTATASSNLPVVFSSTTAAVCTISGGTLAFVTPGSCNIAANQGGDASYHPAPQVSQSFNVNAVAPGAPTIGNATAGDGQATVTFTAPASTGGAAITNYTVTATPVAVPGAPGVITQSGASSPIVVAGLSNGFTYDFTIVATNGTVGAASASVQATPRKVELVSAPGSVPGMTGIPSATMSGGGTTCTLQSGGGFGPVTSTPPNLQAPSGQFAFSAENCTGSVTMTLTYPSALPEGVQFRKPDGAGGWFDPATALNVIVNGARTTVTYTITDNGPGDTNPAVGVIADPLVPVLAAVPAVGAAAIPTLSEWGVILMSALLAMFGLRRMRRQR